MTTRNKHVNITRIYSYVLGDILSSVALFGLKHCERIIMFVCVVIDIFTELFMTVNSSDLGHHVDC